MYAYQWIQNHLDLIVSNPEIRIGKGFESASIQLSLLKSKTTYRTLTEIFEHSETRTLFFVSSIPQYSINGMHANHMKKLPPLSKFAKMGK